jgi:hypothetical protein
METNSNYNVPLLSKEEVTNATGYAEFELGGNNYTVSSQIGQIFGYKNESVVTLKENSETTLIMDLDKFSWLLPPINTLMILELSILVSVIVLFRKKLKITSSLS